MSNGSTTKIGFADADSIPEWAKPAIAAAVATGVVEGYEDNTFRSDYRINRSEMTAMAVRVMKLDVNASSASTFSDADQIPAMVLIFVQKRF
ncbi:S-layer homology domain-containing protein [Paenibacillus terrigena]|uniref:S-layer homology domain-containing protein n=1 Tax=Paenibacillus terrigena TaxID=369333 RepID=UPI0003713B10|nr:S-layer homology domain-containing protein [Paenibacillus terrigena]